MLKAAILVFSLPSIFEQGIRMPDKVRELRKKPNVLFIMGDDIGWFNLSCYNMGIMGYRTPKIDRISQEGAVAATGRPVSRAA